MADIWINILGDATKLKSALGGAGKDMTAFGEKIGKMGRTMTIIGGAVTAAFGMIVKKTMDVGDQFDKMSLRTGVAVEDLSTLAYAADICGSDIGTVEKGLKGLTKVMDDASRGIGEGLDAFRELNIAVIDTEGNLRPTIDVLKEAATKISAIEDPTKQAAYAMDLFGARAGPQLLPLLKEGGEGIEALMEKAKELGIVMSTEAAAKAAEFSDRLTDLKGSIGGMGRDIGNILIPPLINLAEKALKLIKRVKEWADANKPLVEMIVKLSATIGVMAAVGGPILMAVGALIKMKAAIVVMGTISAGPIGLAIVAIAALAAGYLILKENIKSAEDYMSDFRVSLQKITELEELDALILDLTGRIDKLKIGLSEVEPGEEYDDLLNFYNTLVERLKEAIKAREELTKVEEKSFEDILAEVDKMAEIGDILQPAEKAIKKIVDAFTPYEKKLAAINDRYDEAIERIKTIIKDEEELKIAIDTLNEGRAATITLLDREKTALEKVAEAKKRLADLTKSLTDKIYEFTHTEEEVKLRDINREYDSLIENAKEVFETQKDLAEAMKTINEKRQEEIDGLKELHPEKEEAVEDNEDLADSYKKLKEPIEEAGEATKKLGILGGETWEGLTSQIKHTTTALNDFTKEGIAATIANIKMHFKSLIDHIRETSSVATGIWAKMAEANIANLEAAMAKQIGIVKYGYGEYLKILESMETGAGGGRKAGGVFSFPSYQAGIPYVPETGVYLLHKGEAVIPAIDTIAGVINKIEINFDLLIHPLLIAIEKVDKLTNIIASLGNKIIQAILKSEISRISPAKVIPTELPQQLERRIKELEKAKLELKQDLMRKLTELPEEEEAAKELVNKINEIKEKQLNLAKELKAMRGGTTVSSYQFGTPYVPKTQLALVHRGEEINPPGQRSYDQRKSYSSTSSINIMPGAINIITPKFSEADGQEMFGIIERQAKMRGLKLVRE